MKVTRYVHGFGKFGPMEQNKDGDWIKYEDAVKGYNTLLERIDTWKTINDYNDEIIESLKKQIEIFKPYFDNYLYLFYALSASLLFNVIALIHIFSK